MGVFTKIIGGLCTLACVGGAVACAVPESREWMLDKTAPYSNVYKEMEKENIYLKDEVEKVKEELGLKTEELENTKTLLTEKETALSSALATIKANEETITSLNTQIANKDNEIAVCNARILEIETQLADSESEKETMQAEIDRLTTINENLRNTMNRYLEQRDNALARNELLQSQVETLQAEIETLQAQITTLQNEKAQLEEQLNNVSSSINGATVEYLGLGYRIETRLGDRYVDEYSMPTNDICGMQGVELKNRSNFFNSNRFDTINFCSIPHYNIMIDGCTTGMSTNHNYFTVAEGCNIFAKFTLNNGNIDISIDDIYDDGFYFIEQIITPTIDSETGMVTNIEICYDLYIEKNTGNTMNFSSGIKTIELEHSGGSQVIENSTLDTYQYSMFFIENKEFRVSRDIYSLNNNEEIKATVTLWTGEQYVGWSTTDTFQMELVAE